MTKEQKQKDAISRKLEKAKLSTQKKFSVQHAAIGNEKVVLNAIPSPSLMYDYKSGIGGFPLGHMVEEYGMNGLGKTSAIGYGVLANVQRANLVPVIIAMEPTFDSEWAQALHGLDPDLLLILRPDNAEQAFEMLYDLVFEQADLVDYIMVDSIGAMGNESSQEGGKKKAFGISGTVTSGLNDIMPKLYKNNQGLLLINQQRQDTKVRMTLGSGVPYESPGGEALKHHAMVRLHLRPGKDRFTEKVDDEVIMIGRKLKIAFKKNKLAQAVNKAAEFNFFHIKTPNNPFGVDRLNDILDTGKVAGVIRQGGATYYHNAFPDGKIHTTAKLQEHLFGDPDLLNEIRKSIMSKMLENEVKAAEEESKKLENNTVEISETTKIENTEDERIYSRPNDDE